ncbi:SdpI family protein [Polaribacter sp. R77954]|uniref:SdpI family protein n=1 Tax=Polaribacter sp. R77954 TaxID=3093870 RepID=UPI0037C82ABF
MSSFTYVLTTNGVLFLISVIFWKFPPKKINNIYGYRTPKAMQNQQIWDFANNTFNEAFLKYSGFSFLAALLLATITKVALSWEPMVLVALSLLVSIVKTERSINDNFTDEGKKKK